MRIIDYRYIKGTEPRDRLIAIPELDRNKLAASQFIDLAELNIELTRPTAFIYLGGTTVDQSEAGLGTGNGVYFPAIKSGSSYCAHQWASTFANKEHLVSIEVVEGTCAAGINAVKRAHDTLYRSESLAEEVIIIGHERITNEVIRSFKELGMKIVCGDGFVFMRMDLGFGNDTLVSDIKWKWTYQENPFLFDVSDLSTLIPDYRVGYVKLHGTGTTANNAAESFLETLATPLKYKDEIGHTQGISALIETCLVLDDPKIGGRILVTANGFGGYYGAFTLTKQYARNA